MTKWHVRVTRDLDQEYADVEVEAVDLEEAKTKGVAIVEGNPGVYFDEVPPPRYYVSSADVPEPLETQADDREKRRQERNRGRWGYQPKRYRDRRR